MTTIRKPRVPRLTSARPRAHIAISTATAFLGLCHHVFDLAHGETVDVGAWDIMRDTLLMAVSHPNLQDVLWEDGCTVLRYRNIEISVHADDNCRKISRFRAHMAGTAQHGTGSPGKHRKGVHGKYISPHKTSSLVITEHVVSGDTITWTEPVDAPDDATIRNGKTRQRRECRTAIADVINDTGQRDGKRILTLVPTSSWGRGFFRHGDIVERSADDLRDIQVKRMYWLNEKAREVEFRRSFPLKPVPDAQT